MLRLKKSNRNSTRCLFKKLRGTINSQGTIAAADSNLKSTPILLHHSTSFKRHKNNLPTKSTIQDHHLLRSTKQHEWQMKMTTKMMGTMDLRKKMQMTTTNWNKLRRQWTEKTRRLKKQQWILRLCLPNPSLQWSKALLQLQIANRQIS